LKRLNTGVLALLLAAGFGVSSVIAAPSHATQGNTANSAFAHSAPAMLADDTTSPALPPADFGSAPSGAVPILFNDHHVYAKPSALQTGRVLAALVRGETVLVPLRSLFEQTGASVSYDPSTKTVDVSKPGSDVRVTVGRPEVIINGESRPLDVPPVIEHGTVLVPLRVLAEGMGAYVQWVPDQHVVVIRYVTATPPPPPPVEPSAAPVPSEMPTVAPTPTPAPTAKPVTYERYVIGDYLFVPKVYNEFNNGGTAKGGSFGIKAAAEFPLFNLPWLLEGDYRTLRYPHDVANKVTIVGGNGQAIVPSFTVRDYDFDGHFAIKVANPRIYVGVGYLYRDENTGYPRMNGVGFGIEKAPDLDHVFSIYGSAYYYPSARSRGQYFDNQRNAYTLAYRVLKYGVGGTFTPSKGPVFLDFGWEGERGRAKNSAPANYSENGPFVGLGIHF